MPTLNQLNCVLSPSGSPVKSGRHGPELTEQFAPETEGVNGRPLAQVETVLICQPPSIRSTALDELLSSAFPFPIGKSHTFEKKNRWVRSSSVGPRPTDR